MACIALQEARAMLFSPLRWMKDVNGVLLSVKEDGRVWMVQGTLNIRKVVKTDAGKYQCIVRNSIGERRIESALIVTAPLSVSLLPPHQVLNIGQEATFTCNVSGYPVHGVSWRKDQRQIVVSNRVQLLSRDVLHIASLRREDRGMYQCFVYNDQDGAQGTAELKISDVPPSIISVFPEQTAHPGETISLKCTSSGNPIPRVTWYLDGSVVGRSARTALGDYVTEHGHVISFLNLTETRPEDGGEYKCHVGNDVGSTSHAARLNVYGPVFVRPMPNITAISGEDLTVRCPYGGYPIKGVRWNKGGILLPLNHRQKVSHGGILTIQSVQRAADEGEYSCTVRSMDGLSASGNTHVSVVVSPMIDPHFFRESNTVDEGARTKLVCIVTRGDPPLRFHWLKNGLPFLAHGDTTVQTTEDSSIVTFKKVTSSDRGLYTCVSTNVASSANMTMQLVVNVPPQWTVEPKNATVVLGNTVWMDCAAVGFPAPSILWKKLIYTENTAGDFTYVHSSPRAHRYNNGTLVLSDAEENDAGAYLCQANNGIGAGLSKIVSLQVLVPPRFKDAYQSKATREELNVTLKCDASGHAPITITWHKNKTVLEAKTNPRYFIRNISKKHQTISELQILNSNRNDTGKYTCSAVSDIGTDEAIIQFVVQGLPDSPSNVTVVNTTSRSVSLIWEVNHNGNSHITGSIVQYQTTSDMNWNGQTSQLIVSGTDNSATLRALTPVTLYYLRVIAENAIGQSNASAVINVTTEEEVPSGSPRDVQVHSTGAQSMKVSWKPPPEDTQHGFIKGYYIGYRLSSSTESYTYKQVEHQSNKDVQSTYITGLQPFTKYDIVIKAYNSAGAGPKSSRIVGKTLETAPPTSPVVQIDGTTSSTIEVSWKKDVKDKSAAPEYTLFYKPDDGDWKSVQLENQSERHTLTNLRCGTRYQLYMTASNSLGTGEPSPPVYTRTLGAAPKPPLSSVFLQPNATSILLNLLAWENGGCPTRHFIVQHHAKYQTQWTVSSEKLEMPRDHYVIRNLIPDRDYVVKISAHSEAGITQEEYSVRTLAASSSAPTSSPAFGKRETDLPFYKNIALVVPVVVSSLVILVLLFAIVVCFRKHSQDRRGRNDYDNRKPCGDSLMMSDMAKQITTKSTKFSHYTCPAGKTEYAEPYTCNDTVSSRQQSDGLFATIKRCPTRPIYMSAPYKPGSESLCSQHSATNESTRSELVSSEKWSNPRNNSKPQR
ncbi:cell adhesion molecule Dscam2-like [Uloborus diversus]|uniref:cell adhesion molecule Dscam2-like n=1 Tax=Uloborus diversus TaxID=327109 RepID=UPI00240A42B5|nr:cell adhesion molecule Dscam2-like [Uloborus diversus]